MKKMIPLIIILFCLSVQGCIFVAGAAAGAAGVAVVYDHRKVNQILIDQQITNCISKQVIADPELSNDSCNVDVTCFNQVVLLTGQTTSPALREKAECFARSAPNVRKVYNQITIKGPSSPLTHASDTWITTKIKTEMLATQGLKSSTIKVVTENGTVYLMGIVTHEQADMAVDIARQASGVQRVIKIFQYRD